MVNQSIIDKKKQGRRNKANGAIWERKVRQDLVSKGYICAKWTNQVDLEKRELVHAKHKFNFFTKVMSLGSGFPDFIAYKKFAGTVVGHPVFEVIGVECKCGKYLDAEEKEKCKWLLTNGIFSQIFIAKKTKVKNRLVVEYQNVTEVI